MFEELIKLATGGLDKIAADLYQSAKGVIRNEVREKLSIERIRALIENISQIGKVKTIFNPDKILDLGEIYCEGVVTFDEPEIVHDIRSFNTEKVLLQGGPGQGKSIYLKYLCLEEAKNGHFIPIFIEFRNLSFERPLKEELIIAIQNFGIKIEVELFDYLAKSEKLLFILDGFDEVPSNVRIKTARELEQIAKTYKNLRIVVSSRPDAGLGASVYFKTFKIKFLSKDIQEKFLKHLFGNEEESRPIEEVLKENEFLSDVTRTPLLLTLFAITYKARQFKPDSISEFYSIIFPTMLYRHDRMKLGFERERRSKLSDYQIQRIFETLCFLSLKAGKIRFNTLDFKNYLNKSTEHERIKENLEDELIDDITLITALIIEDGYDNYSYVHKSIQEYFSSVFISRLTDDRKFEFYDHLVSSYSEYEKWKNVINFLSTIDVYNYQRYFLLPLRKKSIGLNNKDKLMLNYSQIENSIGSETKVRIDENGNMINVYWDDTYSSSTFPQFIEFIRTEMVNFLTDEKSSLADYLMFCEVSEYEHYQESDGAFILNLLTYITNVKRSRALVKYISVKIKNSQVMNEINELENEILRTDKMNQEITSF
ncbi:NACHT domain-containing protein [Nitrosomonas supralitoralis]|nr:NACHT domain-containing protein [Nitrosomonas supralitoralis]